MKPTIGRIVHYLVDDGVGGNTCAAIISDVLEEPEVGGRPDLGALVSLHVFTKYGTVDFKSRVRLTEKPEPGRCFWPPRVP